MSLLTLRLASNLSTVNSTGATYLLVSMFVAVPTYLLGHPANYLFSILNIESNNIYAGCCLPVHKEFGTVAVGLALLL